MRSHLTRDAAEWSACHRGCRSPAEKRGRRTHRGEVKYGCSVIAHVATELEDPLFNCPEEYYGQQRAMLLASTTHARLPSKLPW